MWAINLLKTAAAIVAATTKQLSADYVADIIVGPGNLRKLTHSSCLQRAHTFGIRLKKYCKFITAVFRVRGSGYKEGACARDLIKILKW